MFTSINLYNNLINCNENIPAPKHVLDPVMNINLLLCLYNNLFKLPIYNNSIVTTIALFRWYRLDLRIYKWFFTFNRNKSTQIQHGTFAY
jgi:hypothetical protein